MGTLIIVVLVLALLLGGVGLFIEGLFWVLVIALGLFIVSAVLGWGRRGTRA